MDNAQKQRELEIQARKEREEAERERQEEALKNAKQVGDHLVDEDSGEIIEQPKEHVADYRYDMHNLTDKQKQFLDKQFKNWHIDYTSKEL